MKRENNSQEAITNTQLVNESRQVALKLISDLKKQSSPEMVSAISELLNVMKVF